MTWKTPEGSEGSRILSKLEINLICDSLQCMLNKAIFLKYFSSFQRCGGGPYEHLRPFQACRVLLNVVKALFEATEILWSIAVHEGEIYCVFVC
jgi:hypothetical protein